jgi:hypothetical protein
MIFPGDTEDRVVASEIDFDHDVLGGHFLKQLVRALFEHDVNAVADAFRACLFDGQADMAAQTFIGNQRRCNFASVQSDVNFGIELVKKFDHAHLLGVIGHGDVTILGHDKVDADETRIGHNGFKAEDGLCEDLLLGKSAQDLTEIAHLQTASGGRIGLTAMLAFRTVGFGFIELLFGGGNIRGNSLLQQGLAEARQIAQPADLVAGFRRAGKVRRVHELDVLDVLAVGTGSDFVQPLAEVFL